MPIKIKSFGPFSGGGTYTAPMYFGGEAIGPAILHGDAPRLSRKVLILEDGFSSLAIRGRFKIGRDGEGEFVKSGSIKSIVISQAGEGKVQRWSGLDWTVARIEGVIDRADRGDRFAFENFLNGFEYVWKLAPRGGSGGWAQASANDDRIKGSKVGDQIFAGEGDDRVHGRGGRDDVWAADGDDAVFGGGGGDLLRGEAGDDKLLGGKGIDNLQGGGGHDVVRGGGGDDYVRGEWDGSGKAGDDRLYGDAGDDQISGGGGNDRLWGGRGDDQLGGDDTHRRKAQSGNDKLWGGAGRDTLDGGKGADRLFGGEGADRMSGGDGNDRMFGGGGRDVFYGGDGADYMDGRRGGDETFYGGAGKDVISPGFGDDFIYGGAGVDTLILTRFENDINLTGTGTKTAQIGLRVALNFDGEGEIFYSASIEDRLDLLGGGVATTGTDADGQVVWAFRYTGGGATPVTLLTRANADPDDVDHAEMRAAVQSAFDDALI